MKRLLLTVIASIALCGAIFAQESQVTESIWPDINPHSFMDQNPLVAFVQINGEYVTFDGVWDYLEVAAFVGTELRGHDVMWNFEEDGDPYPILDGMAVYLHEATGEELTFELHNYLTNEHYTTCNAFIMGSGEPVTLVTGVIYNALYLNYDNAVVLNFTSDTPPTPTDITKEIIGYTTNPEYDVDTYNQANYYLISSPVGGVNPAAVTNMTTGTFDFYSFIQDNELEWTNLEGGEYSDMEVGKGYLYANSETVTLTFPGDAYNGDGEFPLNYVETAGLKGVNLMGNPYNANAVVAIEGSTYQNFYVMNADGTQLVAAERDYAEPMEGIFVIASGEGQFVNFTAQESKNNPSLVMNVVRNRGNVIDRAIVNFGRESQLPKFQIMRPTTKVYIPMDGEDYAVVTAGEMGEMPVNFKAEENGTFSMIFSNEDVNFKYLHLIDNMNGNNVDLLANPSYTFEANTTDYASRFRLVFVTDSNADSDNFTFFDGSSWIINNEGNATLQVVDVLGRIISSESINGCASVNINEAAGVYVIRLINGENVRTQKVIVK